MRAEAPLAWQTAEPDRSSPGSVIHFQLGTRQLGLATLDLSEILSRAPLVTVPAAPQPIRGLMMLRGKVLTLLDAAELLGQSEQKQADESVLVLAEPWAHVGLMVPGRVGLSRVFEPVIDSTEPETAELEGLFRETVALEDEQLVHVLDPLAVIRTVERVLGVGGR